MSFLKNLTPSLVTRISIQKLRCCGCPVSDTFGGNQFTSIFLRSQSQRSRILSDGSRQNFSNSACARALSPNVKPKKIKSDSKKSGRTENKNEETIAPTEPFKKLTTSVVLNSLDQWTPIYRFKHVLAARAIQRLKLYQTGLTCFVILPISIFTTFADQAQLFYTYCAFGGSVLACIMLYVMGTFSSRIIGALYVHKENPNRLNMARLTFFGSRQDTELHTDSFIHLADLNENPADIYVKLQTVDNLETELGPLYLSIRYGEIQDKKAFERVFGSLSEFIGTKEK